MKSRHLPIALTGSTLALPAAAIAETTAACPMQPDKLTIATENAKQLMLLMDTDKRGKISKSVWMEFMSAEFDRLDVDKSGELGFPSIAAIAGGVRQACPSGRSGQRVGPDSAKPVGNGILQRKELV